jgi:3-hydroxy-9,10-secoandrosta-1,3,5(10)-triene-9,17-dione monooxygenase
MAAVEPDTRSPSAIEVPDPDLTPQQLIDRARAFVPRLRDEQEQTEERGAHAPELQDEFARAGFYRTLQPRSLGGHEFDVGTFLAMISELGRGCPSTAWGVALGANHVLNLSSLFAERAQREIVGPDGHLVAASRAVPGGTAVPTEDGRWAVNGRWDYASGSPYSTFVQMMVLADDDPAQTSQRAGLVWVPRTQWTLIEDWRGVLGLRGSGSHSVVIEDAVIPWDHLVFVDMMNHDVSAGSIGAEIHGNPMYAGRWFGLFHAVLVAPMLGAAYAALDEYEQIIRTKPIYWPPQTPRYLHHDYQNAFGSAMAYADSAAALQTQVADLYMQYCQRGADGGMPFSAEEDIRLFAVAQQAGQLCWRCIDQLFTTAGSSAARNSSRLQRYFRDISVYRSHIAAQQPMSSSMVARQHFGEPLLEPR